MSFAIIPALALAGLFAMGGADRSNRVADASPSRLRWEAVRSSLRVEVQTESTPTDSLAAECKTCRDGSAEWLLPLGVTLGLGGAVYLLYTMRGR